VRTIDLFCVSYHFISFRFISFLVCSFHPSHPFKGGAHVDVEAWPSISQFRVLLRVTYSRKNISVWNQQNWKMTCAAD
jgi:hypothetical protein